MGGGRMNPLQSCKMMLKNLLIGYLFNVILLFIYAILLTYTNVAESSIPITTALLGMVCVFFISWFSLKKIKKNGLKNGALIGGMYVLLWYFTSSILAKTFTYTGQTIFTMVLYLLLGILGGIIGVNMFY